jgi:Ca2+-binding RTX toxin-like protein
LNASLTSTVTNKDEIFVAGAGNDTLTGNGGINTLRILVLVEASNKS